MIAAGTPGPRGFTLLPPSTTADARRVLLVRGLRAFADGYVAVLLPLYLVALDFDATAIGAVATASLLGSALATLGLGFLLGRFRRRPVAMAAGGLMALTGLGFAGFSDLWPLLLVSFIGTLNPSGGDVSVFLPLEHTILAHGAAAADRTALFARYSLVGSLVAALGALASGLVDALSTVVSPLDTMRALFALYGAIGLAGALLYRRLTPAVEADGGPRRVPLGPSRRRVWGLAALFSVDAFGGGLIAQSILAYWLFARFGLSATAAGAIFFTTGLCAAVSYLVAERLARRFGLVNTMVFSHLPSNLLLILAALAPGLGLAVACLVVRSLLSQMDVPTRTSYVMAVVTPDERPAAASLTTVPRSLAATPGPYLAGLLLAQSSFGWPLVIAGAIKTGYDVALLWSFARVKPPEEA
jgi:MFS family permease